MTHNSGIAMSKEADITVSSKDGTVYRGVSVVWRCEEKQMGTVSGKAGTAEISSSETE